MSTLTPTSKEDGPWRPGRGPWYPREPYDNDSHRQSKAWIRESMMVAEMYDKGHDVAEIMQFFDMTVAGVVSHVRRFSHLPFDPARFVHVDVEMSRRIYFGLDNRRVRSRIEWKGTCRKCESKLADGICVYCAALEAQRKAKK